MTKTDGSVLEFRQPHFRGGVRELLSRNELISKFENNIAYGGASPAYGRSLLDFCLELEGRRTIDVITDVAP